MNQKQSTRLPSFNEHLKRVLEAVNLPEQVGTESPLAAPYFLGAAMRGVEPTALGRGKALCAEIDRVVEAMWWGPLPMNGQTMLQAALADGEMGGRYDCLILELNYFKRR